MVVELNKTDTVHFNATIYLKSRPSLLKIRAVEIQVERPPITTKQTERLYTQITPPCSYKSSRPNILNSTERVFLTLEVDDQFRCLHSQRQHWQPKWTATAFCYTAEVVDYLFFHTAKWLTNFFFHTAKWLTNFFSTQRSSWLPFFHTAK